VLGNDCDAAEKTHGALTGARDSVSVMETVGARVLVVDDEAAIRDLLEYGLGQAGFAVQSAVDGREAIEAIRAWSPEVIILASRSCPPFVA
jgi:PleD family two-component response regulator